MRVHSAGYPSKPITFILSNPELAFIKYTQVDHEKNIILNELHRENRYVTQ